MRGSKEKTIKDIINLYKIGLTNSEIAEELEIELTTVKNYMKRYIRTREDYTQINEIHNLRKKKMQEECMRKRGVQSAKRAIERVVKRYINDKDLCEKWCNSAYDYKECVYRYKYDKKTKTSDLSNVYRAS